MIIGTAGHIDHGKTTLVRALTGIDTDRLPEEKRRGITIELGFAALQLDGVGTVGVVDVPGHEAFVRTMLAGAAGVDVALLVIAADDSVQPQTREHLAILQLLGVKAGVVALTKCDLVTGDWIGLVVDEVRATLEGTPFDGSPIIPVSATRGDGMAELRAALSAALVGVPERDADDLFRLPVDRVFSVRGTGTVVTGTVWSGSLERDADVRILPAGGGARVRALQSHGVPVTCALPGQRVAVALAGIDINAVKHGDTIVSHSAWQPTRILRAEVGLLASALEALGPRASVRFHLGTVDVGASIHAASGKLSPGTLTPVRVVLDAPVAARAGDRFVLRLPAPLATIGGGVVTDPFPPRRGKPFSALLPAATDRLAALLDEADTRGMDPRLFPVRLGVPPRMVDTLTSIVRAVGFGDNLMLSERSVASIRERLLQLVDDHHLAEPLSTGVSLQELRSRLRVSPAITDDLFRRATQAGELEVSGGEVRRAGWVSRITPDQERLLACLVSRLTAAGREPPSVLELATELGASVPELLRYAERTGSVVQVEDSRYYASESLQQLLEAVRLLMADRGAMAPAALRDGLGLSRKFLIPLLEYCDRLGYTSRSAGGRTWLDVSQRT